MYERILVPLDGTPLAEQALLPAVSLARASSAELHIATVEIPTPIDMPELPYEASVGDVPAAYLDTMASRLQDAGVSSVTVKVLHGADVPEKLEAYAKKAGTDLTVISSHGRGPVGRAWLGSVSDRLVRTSESPVLLVRADPAAASPDLKATVSFDRVLVTLDGSALSEAALGPAIQLGGPTATYILASVATPPHALVNPWLPAAVEHTEEQIESAQRAADAALATGRERLAGAGYTVEAVAEFREPVVTGILELAEEHEADVIAIATHGYGGLRRAILGSVADKVIRGWGGPVLVVRPTG